ncbi:TPA: hypothetical protein GXZ34_01570, partial [bacterium]|nr:hypothetical protein [bacterium]
MLIKIIVCLLTPLLFISFFKYFAKIMQSQHYEQRKYFGYIKDNLRPRKVYYHILAYFIMSFIVIFALDNYLRLIIFLLLFAVYLAYLSIDLRVNKDLKISSRIKRTLVSYYLLIFTSLLLVAIFSDNFIVDYALSIIFINLVSFLYISLSFIVIYPLEKALRYRYILKARRKMKNNKDLVVIGVTGSYGKTSCKNMIYNLLEESFNVYKTPKSYNTQMGITLSINDPKFSNFTDYFVCE